MNTTPLPPIPEFQLPKLNIYFIILLIVFSYVLRIIYIKYIKPKLENKEVEKPKITLESILSHVSEIARILMYALIIVMSLHALWFIQSMPDTMIEVPAKYLFLFMTILVLFAVQLLSLVHR